MTATVKPSRHACVRMAQRGYRPDDLGLLLEAGVEAGDGIYLPKEDARALAAHYRRLAERLEHLAGTYAVIAGDRLVTLYHPSRRREKRVLRGRDRKAPRDGRTGR